MPRVSASDRLRRLLAMIPWLAANPGSSLDEICARFEIDVAELRADLEVVWMVGLPPYTPDQLIDVVIEDDRVWLHLGDFFSSPLRLTPDQAFALVAAGATLATTPGHDPDGPLGRGLGKLASSLGLASEDAMDIHLGDAEPENVARLRRAVSEHRRLEIDYYSFGRDERTTRRIDPLRVIADQGQWYLSAWCHRADGERLFRIDRVAALRETDEHFEPPTTEPGERYGFDAAPATIRLRLSAAVRWVLDQYPVLDVDHRDDGGADVTLAVGARPWLERLLLRLGDEVEVLDYSDGDAGELRRAAAARLLDRYRPPVP